MKLGPELDAGSLAPRENHSQATSAAGARRIKTLGVAVVIALTIATFLPSLGNGFLGWDDGINFVDNQAFRGLGWPNLRWMFTNALMGHYIPITWLTLGLDYLLWGMHPAGYHLTAILLHTANAVLFYFLTARLFELGAAAGRADGNAGRWLGAAVAALLFAVHPLRVESVVWITERRDLVSGLFSLLTVHAYLSAWRDRGPTRLHRGWCWASVALFALALLSKSIVVGLPLALLAFDFYPLRRLPADAPDRAAHVGRFVWEKVPFLAASAAVALGMLLHGMNHELMTSFESLGIVGRVAVSAYGLAFYLWKSLVPWPLSPLYELHYPVLFLSARYLGSLGAVLAITLALLVARRSWPAGLVTWVAYIVLLLPVLGIAHNGMQSAADRYSYLACLGWALLAGAGVRWCWGNRGPIVSPRLAHLVLALSATVTFALAGLSGLQIRVWRDSETLWRHVLSVDPESPSGHYRLAGVLTIEGRSVEARSEFERAVELAPDEVPNAKAAFYAGLGTALERAGDVEGAERNYRAALSYSGDNVVALNNLGSIQAIHGQRQDALESFRHVLRIIPGMQGACSNVRALSAALAVTPPELASCAPAGS